MNGAHWLSHSIRASSYNPIMRLLWLRTGSIVVQLTCIVAYALLVSASALEELIIVLGVESFFHILSIIYFRKLSAGNFAMTFQIIADIGFLTLLLAFSGGATNAFVSLLLIPIVIAAVSLPLHLVLLCTFSAIFAYSYLLYHLPMHQMHHMDMHEHFIGMWLNFLLSALVVTFVVAALVKAISNRQNIIASQREEQLRQEQLVALGSAAAQVTHELATPLANLQMLHEELLEIEPNQLVIQEMTAPLAACKNQIESFRAYAQKIKENTVYYQTTQELINQLKQVCTLQFPDQICHIESQLSPSYQFKSDGLLASALVNLIENGVRANRANDAKRIEIVFSQKGTRMEITIRDFGQGIDLDKQNYLGREVINSEHGMGLAVLLSNATFERLSGQLSLTNCDDEGALAIVSLPFESKK